MMNRSVMGRQMFAKGGAAFPDISGDGQVTQKDILMGRGVIPRTMQEGGIADPMMMQGMDPSMVPQEDPMMAQQGEVDPEILAGMFGQMETQMAGIEDSDDLEGMMNAVRGDQQPIEARRAELAGLVGPEDAQVTPESVLALVQPVMQLASLDQGIGGLAEEEMSGISMEGPMGEGIMSTVNTEPAAAPMPPPTGQAMMDPAMMGVGNPPPVNFRQGGVVQYMENGGSPIQQAFDQRQQLYRGIIGSSDVEDQAMLDERKKMSQSQMYFDIAEAALAFATPGSRQMSPAERLADAVRETELFPKLGARGQAVQDLKDKQQLARRATTQSIDMAALGAAEKDVEGQQAITAALQKARLGRAQNPMELVLPDGTVQLIDRDTVDLAAVNRMGATIRDLTKPPAGSKTFIDADTGVVLGQVQNKDEEQFVANQIELGYKPVSYTYKVDDSDSISTGNKLYIASRQDNLDKFGTGELDPNTANVLEGVLIENVRPTQTQTAAGVQTTPAVGLTSAQKASVLKRAELLGKPAIHPAVRSYLFPQDNRVDRDNLKNDAALLEEWSSKEDGTAGDPQANPFAINEGDGLKRETLENPATLQSGLTRSGTVDTDAMLWKIYPVQSMGQLISKELGGGIADPTKASGLDSIPPTAIKFVTEPMGEIFGSKTPDSVKDLTAAQVVRKNINQRFRNFVIEERQGGRMLQEEFQDLTALIDETDPKVFSFDATSIQYLEGMQRRLGAIMDRKIPFAPLYGGTSFDQDAKKTQERMRQLNTAASLLSEVTQLKGYMELGANRMGVEGNVSTPEEIFTKAALQLNLNKTD